MARSEDSITGTRPAAAADESIPAIFVDPEQHRDTENASGATTIVGESQPARLKKYAVYSKGRHEDS